MALPTAQLGQMPTLQMPFYIPVTPVEKHPKLWEQALVQMLTSTAGKVASQGVENYMQPDYAPQPAQGFSKFWNGPTISGQRAGELDRQSMEQARLDQQATQNERDRKVTLLGQRQQATRDIGRQALETDAAANAFSHQQATEGMDAQTLQMNAAHQREQELLAQINALREGKVAAAQITSEGAKQKLTGAQTDELDLRNQLMRANMPGAAKPAVNPNVANFAKTSQGNPFAQQAAATQTPSTSDQISGLLAKGSQPDDVIATLKAIQDRQGAVQTRAQDLGNVDALNSDIRQQAIDAVKRRLGITPDAFQPPIGGFSY